MKKTYGFQSYTIQYCKRGRRFVAVRC